MIYSLVTSKMASCSSSFSSTSSWLEQWIANEKNQVCPRYYFDLTLLLLFITASALRINVYTFCIIYILDQPLHRWTFKTDIAWSPMGNPAGWKNYTWMLNIEIGGEASAAIGNPVLS